MSRSYVAREDLPPPRPVAATFRCDGDHGLFPPPELAIELDGTNHSWTEAVRAGWSIVPERDLCPGCAGRPGR